MIGATVRTMLAAWCLVAGCASPVSPAPRATVVGHARPDPKTFESTRRLDPMGVTHALRGLRYLTQNDASSAVAQLQLALLYAPDSAYLHSRFVMALDASGASEKAAEALTRGLAVSPEDPALNYLEGRSRFRSRQFAEAEVAMRRAVLDSEWIERAGPVYLETLLWQRRAALAEEWSRAALQAHPRRLGLGLALGAAFEDHGRLRSALRTYAAVTAQHPAQKEAALAQARVWELLGTPARGAEVLGQLAVHYPDNPQLPLLMSVLFERGHDAQRAAHQRRRALRLGGNDPLGVMRVASLHVSAGRLQAATALLEDLLQRSPEPPGVRGFLMEIAVLQKDFAHCRRLARRLPSQASARGRVWCLGEAGQVPAMVRLLLQPQTLAPHMVMAVLEEALESLAAAPDVVLARRWARSVFSRYRDDLTREQRWTLRARLEDAWGFPERAKALYERLVARTSGAERHSHRLRLADVCARSGELERGIEILEDLLAQSSRDVVRLNALGFVLADADQRLDEAEVWLRRAYRLAPEETFVIDSLGWLLYRQGDYPSAARLLRRARRAAPRDPEILRHLGDTLGALGEWNEARAVYQAALKARPSAILRRLLEQRLETLEKNHSST